ncbi:acetylornithine deacetylase or succinyl-diaminopimelate desuccinylase [Aciduliprofundum sp. MAR08-339]|uniref:M20 family metallo-hydrolase n=1 Tax=Aciduliprofundum sp. (strain MAR08-339) TaxID=673860 RepID=UPI0002A47B9C|nr:acetylornithine deacetylase or succinyl-diaminopimelate desuccinylase [Aciduliprofundum sp. MAR08-339]
MEKVFEKLESMREELIQFTIEMNRIKAVNPAGGGEGEEKRADWLEKKLREICDEVERYDTLDENGIKRPNLIGIIYGEDRSRTLWLIGHMDTVPEGDLSLWEHDPYDPILKDGKIYGRGTLDDGQAIVSSYFAAKAMRKAGMRPKYNIGLAYVADEEAGSRYGAEFLMDKGIFKPNDLVVVPDGGAPDGSFVEIAEKSAAWIKIVTIGKQAHASMPHTGVNAHRAAMKFALAVDEYLHKKYADEDSTFEPPISTFEITKKERNVDNINTIPGTDVIYFDFRVLPHYKIEDVIGDVRKIAEEYEKKENVKINVEIVQASQAAPPTDVNSEIVQKLMKALRELRGIEPVAGGIGGGTVAAFFRRVGIPAVVWMTADDVEHQPNEYCRVDNCINDAKVFIYLALS